MSPEPNPAVMPYVPNAWNEASDTHTELQAAFANGLTMYDGTLRKSLMVPGYLGDVEDYMGIAVKLQACGIQHFMLNVNYGGDDEPNRMQLGVARAMRESGISVGLSVYSDDLISFDDATLNRALDTLAATNPDFLVPVVVDPKDPSARERVLARIPELITACLTRSESAALCIGEPSRAPQDFTFAVAELAANAGATRLDIHDSSMSPWGTREFFRAFTKRMGSVETTFHVHPDLGVALACAMEAARYGVHPEGAVGGVSYRAGFLPTEEFAVSARGLLNVDIGLDLVKLGDVYEDLERVIGLSFGDMKPVYGRNQFVRQRPGWAIPLLREPAAQATAAYYDPAIVGRACEPVWDRMYNRAMLEVLCDSLGITLSAPAMTEVCATIDARLAAISTYPRWLTTDEVQDLVLETSRKVPHA